jgi:hypothetical protein
VGKGNFTIEFSHAYSFEAGPEVPNGPIVNFDGGLIEVSTDAGKTWEDAAVYADPGYTGTIAESPGSANPLALRWGFVADSDGFPALMPGKLDFGTKLASKSVLVRFRVGSDEGTGAPGWMIDSIKVNGITNKPFTVLGDNGKGNCLGTGGSGTGGSTTGGAGGKGGSGTSGAGGAGGAGTSGAGGRGGAGTGGSTVRPTVADDSCDCAVVGGVATGRGVWASILALSIALLRRRRRASN